MKVTKYIDQNKINSKIVNLIISLFIWMVSFTAITGGIVLIYQWYASRGPEIQIIFNRANGLVPNQSKIVYLGVQIGQVIKIELDTNNEFAVVTARLERHMRKHIGKDSKFWLVEPQFDLKKISNLNALVAGNYIGIYPIPGAFSKRFVAEPEQLDDYRNDGSLKIILKTSELKGISKASAILYKGIQIGEISSINLSKDKQSVLLTVFINSKYSDLVRKNSYFKNVSGFHAGIHIFGESRLDMDSLSTVISGGISLISPSFNAAVAVDGDMFNISPPHDLE